MNTSGPIGKGKVKLGSYLQINPADTCQGLVRAGCRHIDIPSTLLPQLQRRQIRSNYITPASRCIDFMLPMIHLLDQLTIETEIFQGTAGCLLLYGVYRISHAYMPNDAYRITVTEHILYLVCVTVACRVYIRCSILLL